MPSKGAPIAFMHVPKTAGNAIATGLRRALLPTREVFGWDLSTLGEFRRIETLAPYLRRMIYQGPEQMDETADFITGHIACSTLRGRYPHASLVTFLREPVCRLLSLFLFMRSHREEGIVPWGDYAPVQRLGRFPLAAFLQQAPAASQTDNIVCRMLLWPHKRIPNGGFIDPVHDTALLDQALTQLDRFHHVDVLENPKLAAGLAGWLGQEIHLPRENETLRIPPEYGGNLHKQLSGEAVRLLHARCRLDLVLWAEILKRRMPNADPAQLRLGTVMRSVARFARLLAADGDHRD